MNDWERIETALNANTEIGEIRRNQIWKWTEETRKWIDENGLDITALTPGDLERIVAEVPVTAGPSHPYQRKSAIRQLQKAAATVQPPFARKPGTAAARVDLVAARSPLGKAIARVQATARTENDRRRLATCLGRFLLWCDGRGIPASECWPGDITAYRGWLLENGHTSPGEYLRVARMLVEHSGTGAEVTAIRRGKGEGGPGARAAFRRREASAAPAAPAVPRAFASRETMSEAEFRARLDTYVTACGGRCPTDQQLRAAGDNRMRYEIARRGGLKRVAVGYGVRRAGSRARAVPTIGQ